MILWWLLYWILYFTILKWYFNMLPCYLLVILFFHQSILASLFGMLAIVDFRYSRQNWMVPWSLLNRESTVHIFWTKRLRKSGMVLFCSFSNYFSNDPLELGSHIEICPFKSNRSSWLPSTKNHWIFRDIWVHGSRGVTPVGKKIHKWYLLLL